MLNYFAIDCQIKIKKFATLCLILLLFLGCAKEQIVLSPVKAIPFWFDIPEANMFKDEEYNTIIHPFFDLVPFKNSIDNSLNFIITNPSGSKFIYDFDLYSGQTYLKHPICKEKDVWEKKRTIPEAMPFTQGIVPRLLDQMGEPQQIIVFGRSSFYQEMYGQNDLSHRARIVGGVVENFCSEYFCQSDDDWSGRLVLVAVDSFDSKYRDVQSIEQLKKIEKWDEIVAFLENAKGRSFLVNNQKPAYQIKGEIAANEALEFAFTKGHLFSFEELKTLQTACIKLYEFIWNEFSKLRQQKGPNFSAFFNDIYLKRGEQFYTCSKYVRTSNINYSPDRHWFFTFLSGFFRMEADGYYYGCRERGWFNVGVQTFPKEKRYSNCDGTRLEDAFDNFVRVLDENRKNDKSFFRYISYDSGVGGSHKKLYSFVDHNGKRTTCDKERLLEKQELFPDDVFWNRVSPRKKVTRDDIIE